MRADIHLNVAPDVLSRFEQGLSALASVASSLAARAGALPLSNSLQNCTQDKEAGRIAVTGSRPLALAVSGGPDSLALLCLSACLFPDAIVAFTVDHGLRAESADEAAGVAALCHSLAVPHEVIKLTQLSTLASNIQAEARKARYEAMAAASRQWGAQVLLTGHHADDQAETMLMRLARGSGLSGLAGIRPEVMISGMQVARPLLGWRKVELAEIVTQAGITAVEDPSNHSPAYDRTSARALLSLAETMIDPLRVAVSARHLAQAEDALQWVVELGWASRSLVSKDGITLDLADLPAEIRRRLVLRAIQALRPDAKPDGPSLDYLIDTVGAGRQSTLAGIQVSCGSKWRFVVAKPHQG